MNKIAKDALSVIFDDAYNSIMSTDTIYDSRLVRIVSRDDGKHLQEIPSLLTAIMCMQQEELPLDNVWRLEIRKSGKVILNDFTMPSASVKIKKIIKLTDTPRFIQEGLAVLQITSDGTLVDGVGKRISDSIYYILEKHGEHPREEGERCS
jgi:hypothetical protein